MRLLNNLLKDYNPRKRPVGLWLPAVVRVTCCLMVIDIIEVILFMKLTSKYSFFHLFQGQDNVFEIKGLVGLVEEFSCFFSNQNIEIKFAGVERRAVHMESSTV